MLSNIKGHKDLAVGAIFIVLGGALFLGANRYAVGTAAEMGPGYFPALLGVTLALLGVGALIRGVVVSQPDPLPKLDFEALFRILAGIISFALLLESAGLVVASFVCLFLSCFRRVFSNPIEFLALFVVLTAFNALVFIYGFGMVIPLFWWGH